MEQEIAAILLKLTAVKVQPKEPFTFASGLKSPIYIDNRLVISYPKERKEVVSQLISLVNSRNLEFDVVAGVATAGIHWAAWLAAKYDKPMIYVRDKPKDHGRQNRIEGHLKAGQRVLVVEDHISTGGSSVAAVKAVRDAGGKVTDCVAITTYEFPEAHALFESEHCRLHTLTGFTSLIETAARLDYINPEDKEAVLEWNKDAKEWGKKHGFDQQA